MPPPWSERDDLDGASFQVLGTGQTMTWGQSLLANYTDGIVVLHRGRIVYERYAGALTEEGQHGLMSVTKSFTGLLGAGKSTALKVLEDLGLEKFLVIP